MFGRFLRIGRVFVSTLMPNQHVMCWHPNFLQTFIFLLNLIGEKSFQTRKFFYEDNLHGWIKLLLFEASYMSTLTNPESVVIA